MIVGKALTLAIWGICAASFFVAPEGSALARWGPVVFWVMGAAHVLEALVFLPRLRAAEGSLGSHLLQTLLFGMFHVRSLPQASSAH